MSCIPITPVGRRIYDSDWVTPVTAIDATNSLTIGKPFYQEIFTLVGVMGDDSRQQNVSGIIRQIQIRETADSAANIKKPDLIVMIWTDQAPANPVTNTVYSPTTTDFIGSFNVAESDYRRVGEATWEATINPDRYFTTGTEATASNFYVAIVSNEGAGVTMHSSSVLKPRIMCEPAA